MVAASQAIAATQQMQQGRRTASLKASYEAIHGGSSVSGGGTHELMIGRELTAAAHPAVQVVDRDNSFNGQQRRHKKYRSLMFVNLAVRIHCVELFPENSVTRPVPSAKDRVLVSRSFYLRPHRYHHCLNHRSELNHRP